MQLSALPSILIGVKNLRSNPLRTFLSTLGVIIGVASLMTILDLGDSLENYSREQLERTTTLQAIEVSPRTSETIDGVTLNRANPIIFSTSDIESLNIELSGKAIATLVTKRSDWISLSGNKDKSAALIYATLPNAVQVLPMVVAAGRYFSDSDLTNERDVIILSHNAAKKISPSINADSLLGRFIVIGDRRYSVIGFLADDNAGTTTRVFIPIKNDSSKTSMKNDRIIPGAVIKVLRVEDAETIHKQVKQWLSKRYGDIEREFVVSVPSGRLDQIKRGMIIFKLIMGCITGISLVVGGIGIMNILLASVSERTREIGIRRSTGARKRDILMQFLVESVSITGLGGLTGVILGCAITYGTVVGIRAYTGTQLQTVIMASSIIIAFGSSFLIGVVFGLYPALRASKLSPTEAIRYE
jgi:putative ABC transport system permease protein